MTQPILFDAIDQELMACFEEMDSTEVEQNYESAREIYERVDRDVFSVAHTSLDRAMESIRKRVGAHKATQSASGASLRNQLKTLKKMNRHTQETIQTQRERVQSLQARIEQLRSLISAAKEDDVLQSAEFEQSLSSLGKKLRLIWYLTPLAVTEKSENQLRGSYLFENGAVSFDLPINGVSQVDVTNALWGLMRNGLN